MKSLITEASKIISEKKNIKEQFFNSRLYEGYEELHKKLKSIDGVTGAHSAKRRDGSKMPGELYVDKTRKNFDKIHDVISKHGYVCKSPTDNRDSDGYPFKHNAYYHKDHKSSRADLTQRHGEDVKLHLYENE